MEGNKILTIGDSSVDRFFEVAEQEASLLADINTKDLFISFSYGEKIPVSHVHQFFGGSALNTALGFARLGLQSHIATIVGEDSDGNRIIEYLRQGGVNVDCCQNNGDTNQAVIIIYKKERTILSYHAKRTYAGLELPDCDHIYLTSANGGVDALIPKISDKLKEGVKLYFNPGSWELKNFDLFNDLVKQSEMLILNKSEADITIGEMPIASQLKKILERGAKIAVITDGANGAYLSSGDQTVHMNSFASRIVDPTGAGDSFASALVGAYILNKSIEVALKWGMVNSASVISNVGANRGLLDANSIEQTLNQTSLLKISVI